MNRSLLPLAAAALGLAGSLTATLVLHRAASAALDGVLEERLRGAGQTAAALLSGAGATPQRLRWVMEANRLDGAYLVSPALEVVADATGPSGGAIDLLRVDAERVADALHGRETVARAYDVGSLSVETAYFPVRAADGSVSAVLALEVGRTFSERRRGLQGALALGLLLASAGAVALAVAAARHGRVEQQRQRAVARAARGEAISRMAAAVAHEIRNPLGIIRAAVELVRERPGERLEARDRERLQDVLGEVERLRRLTEDFLDLSAERPLQLALVDLAEVVAEAAGGNALLHPELQVRVTLPAGSVVRADPGRLRQALANLLANAAQAGARLAEVSGTIGADQVELAVRDDGPGIAPELRGRLFDAFSTGRQGGTGLGLMVTQGIVEQHGGTIWLSSADGPGATFRIRLPRRT